MDNKTDVRGEIWHQQFAEGRPETAASHAVIAKWALRSLAMPIVTRKVRTTAL